MVTTYLERRKLLLILDNCEHVLTDAATAAGELLQQCPGLTVLATSRQALGVSGEVIWEVPPLSVGGDPGPNTSLALADYQAAVELFRIRAEAAAPKTFTWDKGAMADAVRICRRLDGIPLAVELAAARTRVLPLSQLLNGLTQRFAVLTTGSSALNHRQRSLEATVDWSYRLLSPDEQAVLNRLSVFAGGFSLEAAEAVCSDSDLSPAKVMTALFGLVEKSLVRHGVGIDGNARYGLLETVREYGRGKLTSGAADEAAHRRHAAHFGSIASPTEQIARTRKLADWMAMLDQELDNFRSAIEWAQERDPLVGLDIVVSLEEFWMRRHPSEGASRLTLAMDAAGATGEIRARATEAAGRLAYRVTAKEEPARSRFHEAAELWDGLDNKARAARATGFEGLVECELGDRELGHSLLVSAVHELRHRDDRWNLVLALSNLGYSHLELGKMSAAKDAFDEALTLARTFEYPWLEGILLESLAELEQMTGQPEDALRHVGQCLALAELLDDRDLANSGMQRWAGLALQDGDAELYLKLMAAAEGALRSIGALPHPSVQATAALVIRRARSGLSQTVADRAWSEGQAMTVADVIAMFSTIHVDEGKSIGTPGQPQDI